MKTSVSLVVLGFVVLGASAASASNYPPGYSDQVVRAFQDGPALFAHVGSGCGSAMVIGYKFEGALSAGNPESIDAIVVGTCEQNSGGTHTTVTQTRVVRLGRDWNGNGYLSSALDPHFMPSACSPGSISVAFLANGAWDSRYGQNYGHFEYGFYNGSHSVTTYETHESACGSVGLKAWRFISEQLRK